jgi:uncharacterized protein YhdP
MTKHSPRHSGKFYLEMLALGFGGLVVAGVLLAWWLIQAPLSLDFTRGAVENAVARKTGLHTSIGHLSLAWQGIGTPLDIQLQEVTVQNQQGDTVATFHEAALGLWVRYLLKGEVRPLNLTVIKPELTAARQPDGSFNLGFGGGGGKPLPEILGDIFNPQPGSTFNAWEQLGIRSGHLVFLDENGQPLGQIIDIALAFDRQAASATGSLTGTLQTDTVKVPLSLKASYEAGTNTLVTHGEFYDLPLDALAGFDPALNQLKGAAIPVAANFDAAFDPSFQINTAHLTITLAEGLITMPDLFPAPVPVASGAIDLGYTANPRKIDLYGMGINLKGPVFDASAVATEDDSVWHFDLTGTFKDIGVDQLALLWPKGVAPGGYDWVTGNLSGGHIDDGTLHLTGQDPAANTDDLTVGDLKVGFKVTGTDVHYFGELPRVEGASGEAVLDQNALTINLTGGHVGDLKLTGGTVVIDSFADTVQTIRIDVQQEGPVSTALDIVNHQPLNYAKKVGIDPASVKGMATTQLHLDFPLLKSLKVAEINLAVNSHLQAVSLPHMVGSHAIENLTGDLQIDTTKLDLAGTCAVETMPVTLKVRRNFNHQNGIDTSVDFNGVMTEEGREKLGFAAPERLMGDVQATGTYQDFGPAQTLKLQLDLTQATLKLEELAYVKPEGHAASASMVLDLQNGAVQHVGDIQLKARDADIHGSADLDPETGKLQRLNLDPLQLGHTNVAVSLLTRPSGDTMMKIKGPVLDVEPLIDEKHQAGENSASDEPSNTEVDVDVASMRTSAKSSVDAVQGTLLLHGRSWDSANFTAMAKGKTLTFAYNPDTEKNNNSKHLLVQTDDAGVFLTGLGLTNSVRGGALRIEGEQPPKVPGSPRPPLDGHLELTNFRLVNAPVMAKMLSLLSLTGFLDSFQRAGIAFDSLAGDFTVGNSDLTISNGKLAGSALGLTIAGTGDRDAGTLDLHGTAVPFYSVNEALNKIPLLGTLLTGGEGQGMFAAAYKVQGTFDKPEVSVNPLSVLTPGIVRDLFFFHSNENPDAGEGN